MEKKVYCALQQRCKCIKFVSKKDISDVEIIRRKIRDICMQDKSLNMAIRNQMIVVQMKDSDREVWCDVEENEEIPDKVELNVIFLLMCESALLLSPAKNISITLATSKTEEILFMDVKVLYSESLIIEQQVDEVNKNTVITDLKLDDISKITCDSGPSKLSLTSTSISTADPGVISQSAPLPPLTFDLEQKLKKNGTLAVHKDLMYHWGSYLWQATAGQPSKRDYQNMANSIVKSYPLLATSEGSSVIVRTTLSSWIRNHRTNLKKQAVKRDLEGRILLSTSKAALITEEISHTKSTNFDIDNALKELEKNSKEGNTPHIRRLLKITLKNRRIWIESNATSICEVVNKYPQLKNSDLLLFEFFNLKNLNQTKISENINLMFRKLTTFFGIEESHEKSKALIIINLYNYLTKRNKKISKSLFIVQEVRSSIKDLIATKGESPRCVIYTDEEDIKVANIVTNQDVNVKIDNPSMEKVVTCLLAVYYVWHVEFPKPYRNILEYLDYEILGTSIQKNQVLFKFIRERDAEKLDKEIRSDKN